MQRLAAGRHGFDSDQPEGRKRDKQAGESTGDVSFGKNQATVAHAQDQKAADHRLHQFLAAGQGRAPGHGCGYHDYARKQKASGDQHQWRKRLETHPDREIGGAPKKADGDQSEVRFDSRVAAQVSE